MKTAKRAHWGSRLSFVLAASGCAIGLGNIWKFPYIAGENGGGAFVLVYLACIAFVGLPILVAELYIGQQSQKNVLDAFSTLSSKGRAWSIGGWFGLISAFLILSFYSVVGGWTLDFEYRSLLMQFEGRNEEDIKGILNSLFANPTRQLVWHFVFMSLTAGVVLSGLNNGLERWSKILMPTLLVILIGLFVYCFSLEGFSQSIDFLFAPNFQKLTSAAILEAIGHSFFTLSLGMGAIMTYGSYLEKSESLPRIAVTVGLLDTLIALMAGVVIFSIVFTFNLEPGSGPGLIFSTLPTLFAKLPGGSFLSIVFFLLVAFAAITSAVSILEVVVTAWTERRGTSRKKTTLIVAGIIFLVGVSNVFSTNILAEVKIFGHTFFDLFDKITSSYLLPLGGLLISLFYGWVLGPQAIEKTLGPASGWRGFILLWSTRCIAPISVILILLL